MGPTSGLGIAYIETALVIPWGVLAVLLGNLFVLHASWRYVYYVSIIYAGLAFVGTAVFYFPQRPTRLQQMDGHGRQTSLQQFLELDFIGIFLYAGGLVSFLLGLSWAGTETHPWRSASVIAPIVIGALGFIACFVYDFVAIGEKPGRHALFPRHLMGRFREYTVSLVVVFVAGMVFYSMSAILPEATFFVFTSQPLQIGTMMLPNGFGQLIGCCIVPLFLHKTRRPKLYIIAAVVFQTIFNGLYAYGIVKNHRAAWMAFQFFGQGGFGLITVATIFNASLHVRPSELGVAVGLLGTFRSMGGSVGNAVFGAILTSVSNTKIPDAIIGAALSTGFKGNLKLLVPAVYEAASGAPGALGGIKGVTPAVEAATLAAFKQGYAQSYQMVFYSTIPFGIIALAAALFVKDSSKYMTNHIQTHLAKDVVGRSDPTGQPLESKEMNV